MAAGWFRAEATGLSRSLLGRAEFRLVSGRGKRTAAIRETTAPLGVV